MPTVVLGLGVHFCVGRPPGGAPGSGGRALTQQAVLQQGHGLTFRASSLILDSGS